VISVSLLPILMFLGFIYKFLRNLWKRDDLFYSSSIVHVSGKFLLLHYMILQNTSMASTSSAMLLAFFLTTKAPNGKKVMNSRTVEMFH
jgi:hypothetical protein